MTKILGWTFGFLVFLGIILLLIGYFLPIGSETLSSSGGSIFVAAAGRSAAEAAYANNPTISAALADLYVRVDLALAGFSFMIIAIPVLFGLIYVARRR